MKHPKYLKCQDTEILRVAILMELTYIYIYAPTILIHHFLTGLEQKASTEELQKT